MLVRKMKGSCGFPKKIRVKKESEFKKIIKQGSKRFGENIVLYRLRSADGGQKFGIKISRGIKGAVKRNRIKRIIRETLRKNKESFDPNEKVVVLFKPRAEDVRLDKFKEDLENLIK